MWHLGEPAFWVGCTRFRDGLFFQPEPNLYRDLPLTNLIVINSPTDFLDLKPPHLAYGFRRSGKGGLNGFFNAFIGAACYFDLFEYGFAHRLLSFEEFGIVGFGLSVHQLDAILTGLAKLA
jgi:hypothetical protein